MDLQIVAVITVLFVAALIASTFGFGIGLIAMPLLAILVDIKTAASLSALVSITVVSTVLMRHWREIQFRSIWRLVVSSCVGVSLGLWLLRNMQASYMKLFLAFIIIAFSCFSLMTTRRMTLKTDRFAYVFGGVSGILGGAYTIPGPPVIVYGILRRWQPEEFRVTLLGYFLPNTLLVTLGYYFSGFMTSSVVQLYVYSLPAIFMAVIIGNHANRSIPKEKFVRFVHVLLILLGMLLSFQAIAIIPFLSDQ